MNDTTPEVRQRMIEIFAGLSAQQRLEKSGRLFASGKQLSEIAVRRRDPRLEGLDLKLAVCRLMYLSGLSEQFLDEVERRARAEKSQINSRGTVMNDKVTREDLLNFISSHKDEFRRSFGVRRIGLFGSGARGELSPESDIDIVVEMDKPDLFFLIGVKQTLEEAFGKKVEVVRLRDTMNRSLRRRIERDAVYV